MDLTIFHLREEGHYRVKDRLNGRTDRLRCGWLEWIGWYNWDIPQRLLGHYRLFQLYKQNRKETGMDLPLVRGYILQYRSTQAVKYFVSQCFQVIFKIFLREPVPLVEIEGLNRLLTNDRSDVLSEFLTHSEEDFKLALAAAITRIQDVGFYPSSGKNTNGRLKGKEEGVFSKKQILILFDLLAGSEHFEKIDFRQPNRHPTLAALFHALTGREKSSYQETLKDYRNHGLYRTDTEGQLNELKGTLRNLGEPFENAGYYKIADLVNRKIQALEAAPSR